MKLLRNIAIVLIATFALTSCGGSSPEAVAEKFLTAIKKADFETAKKYASPETEALLGFAAMMPADEIEKQKEEGSKVKIKVVGSEISEDGTTAKVTIESTDKDGNVSEDKLDLKKIDGEWKVSMGLDK